MNLSDIVTNPIFSLSGWIIGLVSLVLSIIQFRKRRKFENQLNEIRKTSVSDQAQYFEKVKGDINI